MTTIYEDDQGNRVQWDGMKSNPDGSQGGYVPLPPTMMDTAKDIGIGVAGGFNRGLLSIPAAPVKLLAKPARALGLPLAEDPVMSLANRFGVGMPPKNEAQATGQRFGQPIGMAALPIGASTVAAGRGLVSGATALRASAAELAAATGAGAGAEIGHQNFGPTGELVGSIAGSFTPAGVAGGTKRLLRGGPQGVQNINRGIDDFAAIGATPSTAEASGNTLSRVADKSMTVMPGGQIVNARRIGLLSKQLKEKIDSISTRLSPHADPVTAGATIEHGITGAGGFVDRFKGKAAELYDALDVLIPPNMKARTANSQAVIAKIGENNPAAQPFLDAIRPAKMQGIQRGFQQSVDAGLDYQALKAMRTAVGAKLAKGTQPLVDDISRADYKRIYGALSEDIAAVADSFGPSAAKAEQRASAYWKAGMGRIDDTLAPFMRAAKSGQPEKLFLALERSAKEGPSLTRKVMRSLKSDERDAVTSLVLRRMGKARDSIQDAAGDAFSPETFLTTWNKMDPHARRQLFSNPRVARDIDRIASVTSRMRDVNQTLFNPSGTAAALGAGLAGAGLYAGFLPQALAVIVGSAGTKALLDSPRFVRWLATSTRIPAGQLPAHLEGLANIAAKDPEMAPVITSLLESMAVEGN